MAHAAPAVQRCPGRQRGTRHSEPPARSPPPPPPPPVQPRRDLAGGAEQRSQLRPVQRCPSSAGTAGQLRTHSEQAAKEAGAARTQRAPLRARPLPSPRGRYKPLFPTAVAELLPPGRSCRSPWEPPPGLPGPSRALFCGGSRPQPALILGGAALPAGAGQHSPPRDGATLRQRLRPSASSVPHVGLFPRRGECAGAGNERRPASGARRSQQDGAQRASPRRHGDPQSSGAGRHFAALYGDALRQPLVVARAAGAGPPWRAAGTPRAPGSAASSAPAGSATRTPIWPECRVSTGAAGGAGPGEQYPRTGRCRAGRPAPRPVLVPMPGVTRPRGAPPPPGRGRPIPAAGPSWGWAPSCQASAGAACRDGRWSQGHRVPLVPAPVRFLERASCRPVPPFKELGNFTAEFSLLPRTRSAPFCLT